MCINIYMNFIIFFQTSYHCLFFFFQINIFQRNIHATSGLQKKVFKRRQKVFKKGLFVVTNIWQLVFLIYKGQVGLTEVLAR